MKPLRIGHLSTAYHTAFILMGGRWVQDKMGKAVKWTLFPTGPAMVQAFRQKALDIGYIGLPPAMIGIDQGLAIQCIAGGHVEGTILIAVPGYKTINELGSVKATLEQFKGTIIGTPSQGSIHDVIIRHLIDEVGLQSEIEIKNFVWADCILEAMEDKNVEGGCGTPPLAVLAKRYFDAPLALPSNVLWPFNPSYGIVATSELVSDNPDVVRDFLLIHEEACNLMRLEPKQAAKLAVKEIGLVGIDFLNQVFRVSPKYCASLPSEYIESTLAFVPVLKEMGYISQPMTQKDIFNTKIIEKVHREPHHYGDPGKLG